MSSIVLCEEHSTGPVEPLWSQQGGLFSCWGKNFIGDHSLNRLSAAAFV